VDEVEETSEKRKRGRPKVNKDPEPEKPVPEKPVANTKST